MDRRGEHAAESGRDDHEKMSTTPEEQPAPPVQPPPRFKPWVGVVLSFLVSGLGPFAAGRKKQGVAWFGFLFLYGVFWIWSLGVPSVPLAIAMWGLGGLGFALWVIMLSKSYLPVPRFPIGVWLVVGGLFLLTGVAASQIAFQLTRSFKIPTGGMSPTLQGRQDADGRAKSADHFF